MTTKSANQMWLKYHVTIAFRSQFAASIPTNPDELWDMLQARKASETELKRKKEDGEPIVALDKLAEEASDEAFMEEPQVQGHVTFKSDEIGLYYEERCVKSHIKDCANQIKGLLGMSALKSKVANRLYIEPSVIHLGRAEPDGYEIRLVHAWTPKGMINAVKKVDYVENATIEFTLKVLNDGVITEDIIRSIFDYGAAHGMGQERSQGWGKYGYQLEKMEVK